MTKKPPPVKMKLIRITNLHDITVKQVYAYVRSLHRHIREQNARIRKLRRKIVELKKRHSFKSKAGKTSGEQHDEEEEEEEDDVMKALERAEKQQEEQAAKAIEPLDVKAFVDDIKKTAQEFDYQNRYIFEPTSGLYYDPETGYYYNHIYGLHYDGQRGCYLKYNEQTQEYEFYSQVMPQEAEEAKPKTYQKKRKRTSSAEQHQSRRRSIEYDDYEHDDEKDRDKRGDRERRPLVRYSFSRSRSREREVSRRRHRRSRSRSPYSLSSRSSSSASSSSSEKEEKRRRRKRKGKAKDKRKKKRKDSKKQKKNKRQDSDENNREEGELDSSSGGSDTGSDHRVIMINSTDSERENSVTYVQLDQYAGHADIAKKYPPSLRLIVKESNVAALKQGSLFIITCKGGSLGREGDHDVIIPDINVSKYHLKFTYNRRTGSYQVVDLGSRNGTLLNSTRMAPTMQESDHFDIVHEDVIELNRTKLLCHIHDGTVTCENCEPGLLMKESGGGGEGGPDDDRIIKPVSHKEGLKLLQKRYGLEDEKYVEPTGLGPPDYNDRAATRRKTKGSSNEHAKTQVASVDKHIGSENKGFKMLSKLGWSEGQSLGKNDDGLKEPIPLASNVGTSGLGSQSLAASTVAAAAASGGKDEKKKQIWMMTQERYKACADVEDENSTESGKKQVASLDQQICSENKGFQMLAKLGWNKGDTLGKGDEGLKEPIRLLSNVGTSGLGSKPLKKPGSGTGAVIPSAAKNISIRVKKQDKPKVNLRGPNKFFEASDSDE